MQKYWLVLTIWRPYTVVFESRKVFISDETGTGEKRDRREETH